MNTDRRIHALIHCKDRDLATAAKFAELEELCWARDKAKELGHTERSERLHKIVLARLP